MLKLKCKDEAIVFIFHFFPHQLFNLFWICLLVFFHWTKWSSFASFFHFFAFLNGIRCVCLIHIPCQFFGGTFSKTNEQVVFFVDHGFNPFILFVTNLTIRKLNWICFSCTWRSVRAKRALNLCNCIYTFLFLWRQAICAVVFLFSNFLLKYLACSAQ